MPVAKDPAPKLNPFSLTLVSLLFCGIGCRQTETVTPDGLNETLASAGLTPNILKDAEFSVAIHTTEPSSFQLNSDRELDLSFFSFRRLPRIQANQLFHLLEHVDTVKLVSNESCGCALTVDYAIKIQTKKGDEFNLIVGVTGHHHSYLLHGENLIDGDRLTVESWGELHKLILNFGMGQNGQ